MGASRTQGFLQAGYDQGPWDFHRPGYTGGSNRPRAYKPKGCACYTHPLPDQVRGWDTRGVANRRPRQHSMGLRRASMRALGLRRSAPSSCVRVPWTPHLRLHTHHLHLWIHSYLYARFCILGANSPSLGPVQFCFGFLSCRFFRRPWKFSCLQNFPPAVGVAWCSSLLETAHPRPYAG